MVEGPYASQRQIRHTRLQEPPKDHLIILNEKGGSHDRDTHTA